MPLVLLHCWLGVRQIIRPVKKLVMNDEVLVRLSVWRELQIVCIIMVQLMALHPKTPSSHA